MGVEFGCEEMHWGVSGALKGERCIKRELVGDEEAVEW